MQLTSPPRQKKRQIASCCSDMSRVLLSDASDQQKKLAVQQYKRVTAEVKGKWLEQRSAELCEMAKKDPRGFWKTFKTQQHNVCPVELAAQFEAFRPLSRQIY